MPTTDPKRRFRLTPGHCLLALLAVEFLLFLSQWFRWLPKGWPVLIAIASVGVVVLGMFVWFGVAVVLRWRFQFSLRSLFILMFAVAISMSWCSVTIRHVRKQQETVRAIDAIDGTVCYEFYGRYPTGPVFSWVWSLFGTEFFADVVSADFSNAFHFPIPEDSQSDFVRVEIGVGKDGPVTDNTIDQLLNDLDRLQELDLSFSGITDTGLEHVRALDCLEYLNLQYTAITDIGLERLTNMTSLRRLKLTSSQVTAAGVAKLQKALPNCKITR
jgi:hypothetical protein